MVSPANVIGAPATEHSPAAIRWQHVGFDALSPHQLYAALQLRTDVFVMEQNCPFQDMDGFDAQAVHVMGWSAPEPGESAPTLMVYARCFPAGVKFAEASIGRVMTRVSLRGTGMGLALMQQAMVCVQQQWGEQPIRISAQARLEKFYGKLGFITSSAPYLEDGIAHIEMLRP
jgi:ElaA protein